MAYIYACTVKTYAILVNNACVKAVYCVAECAVCSVVITVFYLVLKVESE